MDIQITSAFEKTVEKVCQTNKEKNAIVHIRDNGQNEGVTYGELFDSMQRIQKLLLDNGLLRYDRIAVISPHTLFSVQLTITLAYCHYTSVMIDASLPVEEINRLLAFADVRAVFTTAAICSAIHCLEIPIFDICSNNGAYKLIKPMKSAHPVPTPDPDPEVITILFSSGTTSSMNGVMVRYDAFLECQRMYDIIDGQTCNTKLLQILPIFHIAGYFEIMQYFLTGREMGIVENISVTKLAKSILQYQPKHFAIVPNVYEAIEKKIRQNVNEKGWLAKMLFENMLGVSSFFRKSLGINAGKYLFRSVNRRVFGNRISFLGSGGSPCKASTSKFFLDLGHRWADFYATTETSVPAVATTCLDKYPVGTVGRVDRFDGIEIKINNPDENGLGEIYVKSVLMMKGYFRNEDLTVKAYDDGYFKTGDYGYIDRNNYLFVTGRIKEAIHLYSGKKVSPIDIDHYYQKICPDVVLASCGVPVAGERYDEIHLFIESANGADKANAKEKILKYSAISNTVFKIKNVHIIEKLPLTSVGKVRRFMLKDIALCEQSNSTLIEEDSVGKSTEEKVLKIVKQLYLKHSEAILKSDLTFAYDLSFDSLTMLELCVDIEGEFGIDISGAIGEINSIQDLIDYLECSELRKQKNKKHSYDINQFPLPVSKGNIREIVRLMKWAKIIWDFDVKGLENIPTNRNYILCPNHQSRLDILFTWTAIGPHMVDLGKIACLAAQELLNNPIFRHIMCLFGAIPTDRKDNPAPAMKKCLECLRDCGYSVLIHPEGTVTKDGEMNPFKGGAAKLSIDSGIDIIPVRIEGSRMIWRLYTWIPKFYDFKNRKKLKVHISFGKPISPDGKNVAEITELIRRSVVQMGDGYE